MGRTGHALRPPRPSASPARSRPGTPAAAGGRRRQFGPGCAAHVGPSLAARRSASAICIGPSCHLHVCQWAGGLKSRGAKRVSMTGNGSGREPDATSPAGLPLLDVVVRRRWRSRCAFVWACGAYPNLMSGPLLVADHPRRQRSDHRHGGSRCRW